MQSAARMLGHAARRMMWCAAIAANVGCGGTATEQVIGPTGSRCQIGVVAPPSAVPASGSTVSLNVSAARDCTWTAASDVPWVTLSPTSGQGAGAVSVVVATNAQPSQRFAAVAFNDTKVTISQQPAACHFQLDAQGARVAYGGGRTSVQVSTIDGCEWRVSGSAGWMQILTPGGVGSGIVDIEVSRNEGSERLATVSIGDASFSILQESRSGVPGGPPAPASSSCSFSIDPERTTLRSGAGQGSVRVATDPWCPWTVASGTSWLSVHRSGGSGPDTVTYQVSANVSTTSDRIGSITVAGRTHRVTQQPCDLSVESGFPNLPPRADAYTFAVTTDASCVWTASSTVGWIAVVNASGTGSSAITYRIAANPDPRDRTGTIVVSGRQKLITQQALGQGNP